MTSIPARILRASIAHIVRHAHTKRELAQMQYIESAGTRLFARSAPFTLSPSRFAREIGVSPHTLGRLYCDLEHLLGEILRNYMAALMAELNTIPENTPNRPAHCRAAYHHFARSPDGKLTEAHFLLVRHRHALPPDELAPTEKLRAELNALLGVGEIGVQAAILLDSNAATLDRIETILAILAEHLAPPEPAAIQPPQAANQNQPAPPASTCTQETPCLALMRPPGTVLH